METAESSDPTVPPVVDKSDAEARSILLDLFCEMDVDETGYIDPHELLAAMTRGGQNVSAKDGRLALASIAAVDKDHDGRVSFSEFYQAFRPLVADRATKNLFGRLLKRQHLTMDRLLLEWRTLGEPLSIGTDLDLLFPQQQSSIPLWRFALTGALSGAIGRVVTAPLEKASLMQQTSGNNFREEMKRVILSVEEGGFRSMWSGAGWNGLRVALFGALSTVGTCQLLLIYPVPRPQVFLQDADPSEGGNYDWREPAWRGLMGGTAGLVATVVTHPLDVVRTRVTLNNVNPKRGHEAIADSENPLQTVRAIVSSGGGARALWRGLMPATLGVVPFAAAQHSLYDLSKHTIACYYEPTVPLFIACGVGAGMAAQTLVYPLEVIRRRQIEIGAGGSKVNFTMKSAYRSIIRDGGVQGLYAGILPAYLRVAPAVVISLLIRHHVIGRLDGK
eukprot:scaffold96556_cov50-Attheya_sp.AAC.1